MKLRVGRKLGKYKLRRRLARGGFADVFEAFDTLERVTVALKVPPVARLDAETRADFEREIRINAGLDHPNILRLKNADFVDGFLTMAYPMGQRSLQDRLGHRLSVDNALLFGRQLLAALAYAHERRVIHCDVKPDNVILFADGVAQLGDFGLAKKSVRTLQASSSGTVGYVAPEQAMGRPSARSDVFSAGLILYRMLAGVLPEWPYRWPLAGKERLRRQAREMMPLLERSLQVDARRRFRDAGQMLAAFDDARRAIERRRARRKS
ncbi:MAG: serine/threonine protein kinase [Planctomycetes bacterium]|nr:serine/threonine protein kinase [Planctomycetota bacterium]